jgi:arginine exporter protein ArgO
MVDWVFPFVLGFALGAAVATLIYLYLLGYGARHRGWG